MGRRATKMVSSRHVLPGMNLLADIPMERVLVLGQGLPPELRGRLEQLLPGARTLSLEPDSWREGPSGSIAATKAVRATSCDAVVVAQDYRKLKALALLSGASKHLVFRRGRIEAFGPSELLWQQARALEEQLLGGAATRGVRQARRELRRVLYDVAFANQHGRGNDYGFIESRLADLPADWQRVRASVVIPVYNRRSILDKTLAALCQQSYPRTLFEVIVADDGSSDHPEEVIRSYEGSLDIRWVAQEDLGFRAAAARNLGITDARGEVIVLLDCDMLPAPELLERMLKWFHAYDGPLVVIGDRKFVQTDHLSAAEIRADFNAVRRLPPRPAPTAIQLEADVTLDWRRPIYESSRMLRDHPAGYRSACSGNVAFWRRDAVEAGLFDESYARWGGEDIEFAYRLYRRGAYFVPELSAAAYHQEHDTAHVREEDREVTARLTRSKIPHLRRTEPGETHEAPVFSVILGLPEAGRNDGLENTLRSLDAQIFRDFEIVFSSDEKSQPRVEELAVGFPELRCRSAESPSIQHALNATRGEFALVLGPDATMRPEGLEKLLAAFRTDKNVTLAANQAALPWLSGPAASLSALAPQSAVAAFRIRDWYRAVLDASSSFLHHVLSRGSIYDLGRDVEASLPERSHIPLHSIPQVPTGWRGALRSLAERL